MKKDPITYSDFQKLDFRIGEVKSAVKVEKSHSLLELSVNLGEDYGVVTILTGMARFYEPDFFVGKKFAFLANLEPKPMMGKTSHGMILSPDDSGKPVLQEFSPSLKNGSIVR